MVSVVNATGNNDIDGILWGWKWDLTNITFSFPTSSTEYTNGGYASVTGFQAFNATQQTAVRRILGNVASFTNLTFTETTSTGAILRYANASSIDYSNDSSVTSNTGDHVPGLSPGTAEANPPELAYNGSAPASAPYAQGDSWYVNGGYTSPTVGSFQYAAGIMHETGHNLGLKHGHVTQSGHGVTFPTLPSDHDSYEYSVMTYREFPGANLNGDAAIDHPTTYMQDDIAALQYLYGANYGASANNGDTTYTWNPTTGEESINGVGQGVATGAWGDNFTLMTIWDGGGNDTYDLSNFTTNLSVDLTPGGWTSFDGGSNTTTAHLLRANLGSDQPSGAYYYARGNIANAQVDPNNPTETASLIENAYGGSGNDSILGNSADNTLKGGGGDDQLYGGDGNDTLVGQSGNDTLKGGGGNDTLYGDDILGSSAGNDTLKGGGGADKLIGGGGIDTATYAGSPTGVNVNLATGLGSGGDAEGDTLTGIENLDGSSYDDTLTGDGGANVLTGNDGNDSLFGGAGNDALYGGAGNDTLDGGAGVDALVGGAGDDVYYVDNALDTVTEAVGGGSDTVYASVNYALQAGQEVEYLIANAGATGLTLTGNELSNNIWGAAGNDKLYGGAGDDTLKGGGGADVLDGGIGADKMYGGTGNDIYYVDNAGDTVNENVGEGADTVYASVNYTLAAGQEIEALRANAGATGLALTGNEFNNAIYGGAGNDTLDGGAGNDALYGGVGNDTLIGGAGNDTLDGQTGADAMAGGVGNDIYYVDNAGDKVTEAVGGGADTVLASVSYALQAGQEIEVLRANAGSTGLTLSGNEFDNSIFGGAGNDTLNGGAGNDTLNGGSGADVMAGGTGNDIYYVDNAGDKVTEAVGGGVDTVYASVSYALAAGQEIEVLRANAGATGLTLTGNEFNNTIYGGAGDDTLNGAAGNDTLYGGAGSDTLNGGAGNDTLDGQTGADAMAGGAGNDVYYVDNAGDTIAEAVGGGADTVYASVSYALTAGQEIETLRANAGAVGLTLTGNEFANSIFGGAGNDTLNGGAGNDMLNGGAGADAMAGGAGNDLYYVDNAADTVTEAVGGGADTVYASVSYTLGAGQEIEALRAGAGAPGLLLTGNAFNNAIFGGAGNDQLNGGDGNDSLYGGLGVDTLNGGNGNDTLNGGAGVDVMNGGAGNDIYYVDNAGDTVTEAVGGGVDTVLASVNYSLAAGQEIEALRANSAAGLTLTGNGFNNTVVGGAGNDTLNGGAGNDTLTGGAGSDAFVFTSTANGLDTITDFVSGTDALRVSAAGFGGGLVAGSPATLVTAADFATATGGAKGYFIYDTVGTNAGTIYFDATGGSGADAVAFAKLTGVPALVATDIHVAA